MQFANITVDYEKQDSENANNETFTDGVLLNIDHLFPNISSYLSSSIWGLSLPLINIVN